VTWDNFKYKIILSI